MIRIRQDLRAELADTHRALARARAPRPQPERYAELYRLIRSGRIPLDGCDNATYQRVCEIVWGER